MTINLSDGSGTLRLPNGFSGGGFLTLYFDGARIATQLTPAKMELVLVLRDALLKDANQDDIARGWLSYDEVISRLSFPKSVDAVRSTMAKINVALQKAALAIDPSLKLPRLLVNQRGIGIRLDWELDIDIPRGGPAD